MVTNFSESGAAFLTKGLAAALLLAVLLLVAGCTGGEEEARQDGEGEQEGSAGASAQEALGGGWPVDEVASEVEPSVVQVNVQAVQATPFGSQEGRGVGSGVIYSSGGYIITNSHVVAPPGGQRAEEVNVAFADGTVEEGEVVGTDPSTDLAVVRVDREDLPEADFVEDLDLEPGDLAVAVGSPSGFQSTVTAGVISGLNREVPAELTGGRQDEALVDLIQTDAAISPGNSGGALANEGGDVVGINVAYLPPQQTGAVNIGFAIPSTTAISVADQIIESGAATRPYLGVSLANVSPEIAERFGLPAEAGALVAEVDPSGPAEEAGLERGSVITTAGSEGIETTGDLLGALRDYRPGDQIELTVVDPGGGEREVTVELEERDQ